MVKVSTDVIIKFGNHEYIKVPHLQSWRDVRNAFVLRTDGSHYERVLIDLLNAIHEQHLEDARVKLEESKG